MSLLAHCMMTLIDTPSQTKMVLHAAYGSSKDIWVYSTVGLQPSQIYIVGKVSKKYQSHAQVGLVSVWSLFSCVCFKIIDQSNICLEVLEKTQPVLMDLYGSNTR